MDHELYNLLMTINQKIDILRETTDELVEILTEQNGDETENEQENNNRQTVRARKEPDD